MTQAKHVDEARRRLLLDFLCGSSLLGLRSLVSGVPVAWLMDPRKASAQASGLNNPQFMIMNTSQAGDPINCNAPGTYLDPNILHPSDGRMAPTTIQLNGSSHVAAKPWEQLGQIASAPNLFSRTAFIHHSTGTEQHLHQPDVHGLMGKVRDKDMAVSAFASELAPVLGTVQAQPVVIGTDDSSEAISYRGRPQPLLNPRSLATLFGRPEGAMANLQSLRDRDLARLNAFFKSSGSPAQRRLLDGYAASQAQARQIAANLIDELTAITDNTPDSQMKAAIVLVKMKVAPVITVKVPFGGDNHFDADLGQEADETVSGMATFAHLFEWLGQAQMLDQVTFASFNVFGRTLLRDGPGRSHNRNHHLTLLVGKNVRGGVYGAVTAMGKDYGATSIDSATGAGMPDGDILPADSLPSVGKTIGAALGLSAAKVDELVLFPNTKVPTGKLIKGVIAG